jgi:hypothetical protein
VGQQYLKDGAAMSNTNPSEMLRRAVESHDLETGMDVIDKINDWPEMEQAIEALRKQEMQSPVSSYLLGHLWVRYERWVDAYGCFLRAANLGLNSAHYRAGQILRDHELKFGVKSEISAVDLFSAAARNGHIWSQNILLKERAKSSRAARVVWWLHRLILFPLRLLSSKVFKSRRDNIRY